MESAGVKASTLCRRRDAGRSDAGACGASKSVVDAIVYAELIPDRYPGFAKHAAPGSRFSPRSEDVDSLLEGVDLLVLDNLSTLCRTGRENESDGWTPMQNWLLSLRRRRMSVLLVHHGGKGGAQRGTSKREDVLDTVINLRRPNDYMPTQGARFEVHLEKSRGITGDAAKSFEAQLETRDGVTVWTTKDLEDAREVQIRELVDLKLSVRDIAEELGIPKSTVHRIKKRLEGAKGCGE